MSLDSGFARPQRRPPAAAPPAEAPEASCNDKIGEEVLQDFTRCASRKKLNLASHPNAILVDADRGLAWLTDVRNPSAAKCFRIGIAVASRDGRGEAQLGDAPSSTGKGRTPPGMMMTFMKRDTVGPFQSFDDFIGLRKSGPENQSTEARGILIHRCGKRMVTHGCVCFHPSQWPKIRAAVTAQNNQNGTAVYVHARSTEKEKACPAPAPATPAAPAPTPTGDSSVR